MTTYTSITAEMRFGERVLPTLDNNIKSGNSLIDLDFYDGELDYEPGIEKKIKPFSWKQAFPHVFKEGGFDGVIGNPPYVRQEMLGEQKPYFQKTYKVYHGVADLYSYFFEKGIGLLKPNGLFGIIVANKWMRAKYGEPLRKWFKEQNIKQIIDFGDLPVFHGATTYPCIVIAAPKSKEQEESFSVTAVDSLNFESLWQYVLQNSKPTNISSLHNGGWNLGNEGEQALLKKLQTAGVSLGDYVKGKIYRGVLTGLNEAFVIDEAIKKALIKEDAKSAEIIKPFLAGRDIKRYQPPKSDKYLIFTKRGIDIDNYPSIKKYLKSYKEQLMPKPKDWTGGEWKGRKPGSYKWYEIQDAVDYYEEFEKVKILWPGISFEVASFALDENKFYGNDNNQLIVSDDKYLLGILNSKLSKFQLTNICDKVQGGFYRLKIIYIKQLSIIILSSPERKFLQTQIVKFVNDMLALNKEKAETTLPQKIESLHQRIAYTDDKINSLVYRLYELTKEEIGIIEA